MYIFGASGHGKVVLDILKQNNVNVTAFIDDNESLSSFCNYPVQQSKEVDKLVIAIGDNRVRSEISASLSSDISAPLFHPRSIIADFSDIGLGTVVMAGCVVNLDVSVGKHVILNSNATIEHDCLIEDFVHISPGATLCGGVTIGEGTHIGANAVVLPGIKIGKWCRIGAGAVVTKNVEDGLTLVGNPARLLIR